MLKTFSKSVAALFVAAVLMLGLPALSFADEDTSGGGKQLSDFTDVDWNTVELSFGQSEFTFDETSYSDGVYAWDVIDGVDNVYVVTEGSKELLSDDIRYINHDYFYLDQSGSNKTEVITDSGTYYLKVELWDCTKYDEQGNFKSYNRYIPVKVNIIAADPYDISLYSLNDYEEDFWVGDKQVSSTSNALDALKANSFYAYYFGFDGEHYLPEDAYDVDPVWYKDEETDGSDGFSYTKIEGAPTKYGYYGIRIYGTGSYKGELYVCVKIDDIKHSSKFHISSGDELALSDYETVKDLQDKLQISAYGRNDEETSENVLALDADYKILKWGIENEDYEGDDDDDAAYTEVSLSDKLQDGVYAVRLEPCGDYYGEAVWCRIIVRDLDSLDSYEFYVDCGNRSNLVIGLDDLSISGLKVNAYRIFGDEETTLTQGVDFELGNTWYKYDSGSDGISSYDSIDGVPSEEGPYYAVQAIGKGDFAGQTVYVDADWIYDSSKLSNYNLGHKQYLVAGEGLLPDDLELSLKGDFGHLKDDCDEYERTLTLGTDYTVRWGSYGSNGELQLLDEDKYPEVTEESSDYCLKVIGLGDFEGQELDPVWVTIHKEECSHTNTHPYEKEATCTEAGYKDGVQCSDCDFVVTEPTVVEALGHNLEEDEDTAVKATCTEDGRTADKYCTRCDYEEKGTVIPKGSGTHSYVDDETDPKPAKAATCTDSGYVRAQVCSECGDKKEGYTTEAAGHKYDEGTVTTPATCGADGVKTYTCTVCHETKTEKIPATGKHTPKVTKAAVAASYTATGLTEEKVCSTCGIVLQKQSVIAKLSAKAQSVNVKTATKTVKKAKVKKKAQTVSGAIKVSGAKGKVTYAKASGSGKLKINASNGKITVKKKTKKGTYSIKVRVNVAASADGQFKAYSKTVTVKVKVK